MGDVTIGQHWIQHHPPRLWGVVLAALLLAWLLGAIVHRFSKVNGLNKDPLQHELAHLIIGMMVRGADKDAQHAFVVGITNQFVKTTISDRSRQRERLAHALLVARPTLGLAGCARARSIIQRIT